MKNRSLYFRLIIGINGIIAIVLAIALTTVYSTFGQSLWSDFDEHLGAKVRVLSSMIHMDGEQLVVGFKKTPPQEFVRRTNPEYFQLYQENGESLIHSRQLGNADLPIIAGPIHRPHLTTLILPDGEDGKAATVRFRPANINQIIPEAMNLLAQNLDEDDEDDDIVGSVSHLSPEITVVFAKSVQEVQGTLGTLRFILIGSYVTTLLAISMLMSWVVRKNLAPFSQLTDQINHIDETKLDAVLDIPTLPSDIEPVIVCLNRLIARLRLAFLREKTLTVDIAHELRTPLAGLISTLDVSLRARRENGDYRHAMVECRSICDRMQQMTNSLLTLSRLESGHESLSITVVSVDELLLQTWTQFEDSSRDKNVSIDWNLEGPAEVMTDAMQLQVVISNLIDNAVCYVNEGGAICISTEIRNCIYLVNFTNTGSLLSEDQVEKTFDRFWREDSSRVERGNHAGLGLALCQRIVSLLNGDITVQSSGGVFSTVVSLPSEQIISKDCTIKTKRLERDQQSLQTSGLPNSKERL